MPIPSSGQIKISEVAAEFGDTAPHAMSELYRGAGLIPNTPANAAIPTSGQIAMSNMYGAQNRATVALAITGNVQNYNVYTQASASPLYSAGSTDVTLTISPGVYVGSASTGSYALSVPTSFSSGDTVSIVNSGVVIGRGGNGGSGGPTGSGGSGAMGGYAVYVGYPTTINNAGTFAGGGGGGGGGAAGRKATPGPPKNPGNYSYTYYRGGGGGGGAGYPGGSGGPGYGNGGGGNTSSGGGGGSGYPAYSPNPKGPSTYVGGRPGGSGGGRGAAGGAGSPTPYANGGGGGARGYYLVGNPLVTWSATGTRQGSVS